MANIKLNQKLGRLEIQDFEIENQIVFNYFDALPNDQRGEKLIRALYIGVLALMEDRISSFLAKTANELGTELESLKLLFDMKKELFYKTTVKGTLAEDEVAEYLNRFFQERGSKDRAVLMGTTVGKLPKNKTGDILCELDGATDGVKIAIECKFDKSVRLGEIQNRDTFTRKTDTAWSQLLEAQANRDARVSIIVFDASVVDANILRTYENVGFIPGVGFVAIIDSQKGDFSNLTIAYALARDIAINAKAMELDQAFLCVIVSKIIKDLNDTVSIRTLVTANIENNKAILKQLEKSMLLLEFNQTYLLRFLKAGKLDKKDMLDFYLADEVKDRFKLIEKEVSDI